MTQDERITLDIDTTLMEGTEVRIIESHLRAIQAVVDGAKPQGNPDPVPEWRRLVDEVAIADFNVPLADVLYALHRLACGDAAKTTRTKDLAVIIAVCEQQVGDGWQAEPNYYHHRNGKQQCDIECLIYALDWTTSDGRWRVLGSRAASWLATLTGEGAE